MKLIQIGFTKKPHGLKGELKLHVEDRYLEDLMNAEVVVLQIKGKPTPFFIEDVRIGNAIIGKFEDVDSPETALSIANKEMSLREEDIIPDDEREIEVEGLQYLKCIGYTIFDGENKIGDIIEILETESVFLNSFRWVSLVDQFPWTISGGCLLVIFSINSIISYCIYFDIIVISQLIRVFAR